MRARNTAAYGALAVVVLAGCGSSGHSKSTSSTGTLSRSAFVSQADTICKQIDTALSKLGSPTSASQISTAITKLTSSLQGASAQFQSLSARAPSDAKASFDQYIAKINQAIGLLPELSQAAKTNDVSKATHFESQFTTVKNEATAAAKQAGLGSACTS